VSDAATAEHDKYLVNLGQLADITGISETSLRKWVRARDDFPIEKGGSHGVPYEFDVRQVKAWIDRHEAEARAEREAEAERSRQLRLELFGDDGLVAEEQQKLSAREERELIQARIEGLKLAERQGQILVKTEVEQAVAAAFSALRDDLLGLADALAAEFSLSREARVQLEERIGKTLHRLADNLGSAEGREGTERAA